MRTMNDLEPLLDKALHMAPDDHKSFCSNYVDRLTIQSHSKEQLIKNMNSLKDYCISKQSKVTIEPLVYIDDQKWYGLADACFKIYWENLQYGRTKLQSWFIANAYLTAFIEADVIGVRISGKDIAIATDFSLRSPILFLIKYYFVTFIKYAAYIGIRGYVVKHATPGMSLPNSFSFAMLFWVLWTTMIQEIRFLWKTIKLPEPTPMDTITNANVANRP